MIRRSTLFLTLLALTAFAANSLLCRQALGSQAIDSASFTAIRLVSGAAALWVIVRLRSASVAFQRFDRLAAAMLFAYAAAFSFAYLSLTAGAGALILFAAVQVTMTIAGYRSGEKLSRMAVAGLLLSLAGLAYLVSPGLTAPPLAGAVLMTGAGIAWGIYSLRSRGVADALQRTAANFAGAVPPALLLNLFFISRGHASVKGILLAVISGAVTSGLGYVIWYSALRGLTASAAAAVQLAVPILAAAGGVLLLGERFTLRLAVAALTILAGITLVLRTRSAGLTIQEPAPPRV